MSAGAAPVAAAPASNGAAPSTPQTPAGNAPTPATADGKTPAQAAPKAPEQPWKARRKLTIAGKEVEREYDDRRLQILEHNESQRAQFLKDKADFDARQRRLMEDPDAFFQESGIDVEAILAARAERAQQMKSMTPEQRRIAELEQTLAKQQQAEQQRQTQAKQQAEQQEHQEFVNGNAALFGRTMKLAGLDGASSFERGAFLASSVAVRQMALEAGQPDYTPEQLAVQVERYESKQFAHTLSRKVKNAEWRTKNAESVQEIMQALFPENLEPAAALQLLGKSRAVALVKAINGHMRTSPVPLIQEPTPQGVQPVGQQQRQPERTEWDILDGLSGR